MTKIFQTLGMGGTFDHLHVGHRRFMLFASHWSEKLIIGVTAQHLVTAKKMAHQIQPFETRKTAVVDFCQQHHINAQVIELHDEFGPTTTPQSPQALCVTNQTISGAQAILHQRQNFGLPAMPVLVAPLVKDVTGKIVSSTRVRMGEINSEGVRLINCLAGGTTLTPIQREWLKQPLGQITNNTIINSGENTQPSKNLVVLVGDITLQRFSQLKRHFDLAIFDEHTQRNKATPIENNSPMNFPDQITSVKNKAGEISHQLVKTLEEVLQTGQQYLKIEGEEDLAVLPLILMLPLGSLIYYGQPNQGMVEVVVNPKIKHEVWQRFSESIPKL